MERHGQGPIGDTSMSMLEEFISHIKTVGLARSNRYIVEISTPNVLLGNQEAMHTLKEIPIICDAVSLPSMNIDSQPHRIFGESREMPYGVSYQPINLSFHVDAEFKVKKLFDDWMDGIIDPVSRSIAYYTDYLSRITLTMIDIQEDKEKYKIELIEAWPKATGDIYLSSESREIMKLPVIFQYKSWQRAKVQLPSVQTA